MTIRIQDTWFDQQEKTNLESVTHHKFQTQSKFKPWVRFKLLQSSKITTRPTTQKDPMIKTMQNHEEGPKI